MQLPPTVAAVESGVEYVVDAHDAIPENELSVSEAATGWLYQPFASAEREGVTEMVGDEVSTCSVYCWLTVVGPAHVAEHVTDATASLL